jgi:hypothetical protein
MADKSRPKLTNPPTFQPIGHMAGPLRRHQALLAKRQQQHLDEIYAAFAAKTPLPALRNIARLFGPIAHNTAVMHLYHTYFTQITDTTTDFVLLSPAEIGVIDQACDQHPRLWTTLFNHLKHNILSTYPSGHRVIYMWASYFWNSTHPSSKHMRAQYMTVAPPIIDPDASSQEQLDELEAAWITYCAFPPPRDNHQRARTLADFNCALCQFRRHFARSTKWIRAEIIDTIAQVRDELNRSTIY